ncbi:EF-P 5-aminopentanol modification-associated protein YfmF [Pediococcus acidilactici]|uniref:EF-P 5-aminopentanol modification-associated protein YfmF n=1 Tax=Pediococcus acidilactici TaxID=1254 RepID=UPI000FF3C812|nr:pitrilysin family protein [Pediococcus acidilactici]RWY86482.1 insulinase family protein [Pediococcus acidilactici]
MDVQMRPGVQALIVPSKKFKTVRIDVHFLKNATVAELAPRTLVANLLETSTQRYVNQIQFTHALSAMYGASFGVGAGKKGNLHDIGFSITVANDHYTGSQSLVRMAIEFLNEVISHPLASNGRFDEQTFARQKTNLINYVDSATEDKQFWASQQLRKLAFGANRIQGVPSYGRRADLQNLQNEQVYATYLSMLRHDLVHISVSGDVDEQKVLEDLAILELPERKVQLGSVITKFNSLPKPRHRVANQAVQQARLNLAYDIPATVVSDNFHAAVVFNALFGGSPQSKLFLNVREKASLAYYASSSLDLYNGLLTVQTGIEASNYAQAKQIIQQQIVDLQAGQFTESDLTSIKAGLRSDYLAGLDLQRTIHRRGLNEYLLGFHRPAEQWLNDLDRVGAAQIVEIARQLKPRAEYFLNGDND